MISNKQKKILAFPYSKYDTLICDGAVRSGKTSIEMVAFVDWAMREFNGQSFGICGRTVGSAIKNIINPYIARSYARKRYILRWRKSDNMLEVRRGRKVNFFEVFGGKDESSFMLIQGRTLAGILLDEVVLMPRSFVEQALARCSVEGAKLWFSCNPGNPQHWFKQEWIDRREAHNAIYLHFSMLDNPSLSQKTRERYDSMYSGVFYDRYVRGLWVSADGLVYDMFSRDIHALTETPDTDGDYYVSSDFGIQNATVFLLWQQERETQRWVCLREYYYSGRSERRQKTVSELTDGLDEMLDGIRPKRIIIDPSATALKVEMRKRGYYTQDARNEVTDGISDVSSMLKGGKLAFMPCCENTIKEFSQYMWDPKAAERGEDVPLKQNDHAMDAVRYFVKTKHLVKKVSD